MRLKPQAIRFAICILALSLEFCLTEFYNTAHAQQLSFTISPPKNEITLSPGQSYTNDIQITNNNDFPIEVSANVNDFIVTDQNGTPLPITDNSSAYSLQSWIRLSDAQLRIAPHQSDNLSYTLEVPQNAAPGGHYAMITFSPVVSGTAQVQTQTSVYSQSAALIIVSVPGNMIEKAIIDSLKINYNRKEDKVNLEAVVENQGNIHIKPIIYVSISSTFGEFLGTRILPVYNIFPGASRIYTKDLTIPWWLPGKYTIKVFGSYGQGNNRLLSATRTIWIVSDKIILLGSLVIFALLVLTVVIIWKRSKKSPPDQNEHDSEKSLELNSQTTN